MAFDGSDFSPAFHGSAAEVPVALDYLGFPGLSILWGDGEGGAKTLLVTLIDDEAGGAGVVAVPTLADVALVLLMLLLAAAGAHRIHLG